MDERGPVEQSFPGRGRGLGLAQVATGLVVAAVAVVVDRAGSTGVAVALGALAYSALAHVVFVRPAVLARTGGIDLRGEVKDAFVAWPAVSDVEGSHAGIRVVAGDRVLRARGFAGAPPGTQTSLRDGGAAALTAAELHCQEVAAALRTAARRHQAELSPRATAPEPAEVVRWWLVALPTVLALVGLLVALV